MPSILEDKLFSPGERVLAAVSGGADSMALLHLLLELSGPLSIEICAAHYEHGIRGAASKADADFVRTHCAQIGVPLEMGQGDVPALAALWRTGVEDAARRARHAFLEDAARRARAQKIALAHHLEDQAETLLLRLARGTGLAGLAGMRKLSGMRVRPLLDTPRAQLREYLTERGIPWREDETNADDAYARNYIRHQVFPKLLALNPRAAEAMARTARIAADAADALDAKAMETVAGAAKRLPYGAFLNCAEKPAPDMIRAFIRYAGAPPLSAEKTWALCALLPGGTENLPDGWRALRTAERLHLLSPQPKPPPSAEVLLYAESHAARDDPGDGIHAQALDADALEGAAIRYRLPGDTFAPIGGGEQKLKKTLQDAGVDRPFRDLLPLVAKGTRVLWIAGLKPSADAMIRPETRAAVRFTLARALPWEIEGYTPDTNYNGGN